MAGEAPAAHPLLVRGPGGRVRQPGRIEFLILPELHPAKPDPAFTGSSNSGSYWIWIQQKPCLRLENQILSDLEPVAAVSESGSYRIQAQTLRSSSGSRESTWRRGTWWPCRRCRSRRWPRCPPPPPARPRRRSARTVVPQGRQPVGGNLWLFPHR